MALREFTEAQPVPIRLRYSRHEKLQAINSFCRELGITRSDAAIHLHKLDHHVRSDLEASSPRVLAVLHPLLVVFTNLPDSHDQILPAEARPLTNCKPGESSGLLGAS